MKIFLYRDGAVGEVFFGALGWKKMQGFLIITSHVGWFCGIRQFSSLLCDVIWQVHLGALLQWIFKGIGLLHCLDQDCSLSLFGRMSCPQFVLYNSFFLITVSPFFFLKIRITITTTIITLEGGRGGKHERRGAQHLCLSVYLRRI